MIKQTTAADVLYSYHTRCSVGVMILAFLLLFFISSSQKVLRCRTPIKIMYMFFMFIRNFSVTCELCLISRSSNAEPQASNVSKISNDLLHLKQRYFTQFHTFVSAKVIVNKG